MRLGEETGTVIACTDSQDQPCQLRPACRLKGVLGESAAAFFAVLDRYSVADLMKQPARMRATLNI